MRLPYRSISETGFFCTRISWSLYMDGRHLLLAHGGDLGPTSAADVAVMAGGVAIMVTGITSLLLSRGGRKTRFSKLATPLVTAGLFIALLGPGLLPASPTTCTRPVTDAKLEILSPIKGELLESQDVKVKVRLTGARLVDESSSKSVGDDGHLHLILDGKTISMSGELSQTIRAATGEHRLDAELVAGDHGSFCSRVRDTVTFSVIEQSG